MAAEAVLLAIKNLVVGNFVSVELVSNTLHFLWLLKQRSRGSEVDGGRGALRL